MPGSLFRRRHRTDFWKGVRVARILKNSNTNRRTAPGLLRPPNREGEGAVRTFARLWEKVAGVSRPDEGRRRGSAFARGPHLACFAGLSSPASRARRADASTTISAPRVPRARRGRAPARERRASGRRGGRAIPRPSAFRPPRQFRRGGNRIATCPRLRRAPSGDGEALRGHLRTWIIVDMR